MEHVITIVTTQDGAYTYICECTAEVRLQISIARHFGWTWEYKGPVTDIGNYHASVSLNCKKELDKPS